MIHSTMGTFTHPVGVTVRVETQLKYGLDNIAKRVVHHAISKRRGANFAPLRLVDEKMAIVTGSISASLQFIL